MAVSPLDNKDYLMRLKSFTLKTWRDMPVELSPLVCASKGWIHHKDMTIRCQFCFSHINIYLPAKNSGRCQEYVEMLSSKHKKSCIWSTVSCPEYFLTDETPDKPSHELRMNSAASSMSNCDQFISNIANKILVNSKAVHGVEKDIQTYAERSGCDERSVTISLHGWHLKDSNSVLLLTCDICSRRLNPLADREELRLTDHFSWCPWIKPLAANQPCLIERLVQLILEHNQRHRKRKSSDYLTSEGRLEELKEIKKFSRMSTSCLRRHGGDRAQS